MISRLPPACLLNICIHMYDNFGLNHVPCRPWVVRRTCLRRPQISPCFATPTRANTAVTTISSAEVGCQFSTSPKTITFLVSFLRSCERRAAQIHVPPSDCDDFGKIHNDAPPLLACHYPTAACIVSERFFASRILLRTIRSFKQVLSTE